MQHLRLKSAMFVLIRQPFADGVANQASWALDRIILLGA